jgi:glycosyltransferase involved in cell wall biosynthesis
MQVSHFMPFYDVPGKAAFSGAENHLFSLIEGQAQAGIDVELVMIIGLSGDRLKQKADELRQKGIRVLEICYPSEGLGSLKRLLRLAIIPRLISALSARRHRMLHMHPLTPSGSIMVIVAGLLFCPHIVISYHNNEPELRLFPYKQVLQVMDRFVKRTIVISVAVLEHFVDGVGLRKESTKLVYYGINAPQGEPSKAELRESLGLPQDKFIVGFVGRLTLQKDIPTFLTALKQTPSIFGAIVGGGELEGELKSLASDLKLDNVSYLGPRPNGATIMRAFDVLVLPSKFEGLGLVLLEAMVRNIPIIGSKGGAIPEILEGGKLGYIFETGDVAQLVQAMNVMHDDDALRNSYIEAGFNRVQEKYTIQAMVNNTSGIYKEVLEA